jgi:hypothetical protein
MIEAAPLAPRPGLGKGTVVGLFSNLKQNANQFLDDVQRELDRRYAGLEFVRFEKIASRPADFTGDFLDRCDVAVAAFGD